MSEALKKIICLTCDSSQASEDSYFDEQKLSLENARLKEEVISHPFYFLTGTTLFLERLFIYHAILLYLLTYHPKFLSTYMAFFLEKVYFYFKKI